MSMLSTGIHELDAWLGGGISPYMMIILGGEPGTGKTILAQQIMFNLIRDDADTKVLYLSTLSESLPNVIRHMQKFEFFDEDQFNDRVVYRDLGASLQDGDCDNLVETIRQMIEEIEPSLLVIDSFKAINDMATNVVQFRKFCFEIAIMLSSMRVTTFLVGEYSRDAIADLTEAAVADGIVHLCRGVRGGENQRLLNVLKMRGQNPESGEIMFSISVSGIQFYAVDVHLERLEGQTDSGVDNLPSHVTGLDRLLGGGYRPGTLTLISGISGTGKTSLCLQALIQAAEGGQRCLFFSVEQSLQGLHDQADSLGLDMQSVMDSGSLQVFYVPLSKIRVESVLDQIVRQIEAFKPTYFVLDSSSVLLNQSDSLGHQRKKVWEISQMCEITGCVGLMTSDITSGKPEHLSRFGVEETMADCVVRLSYSLEPGRNQRFVEVLKNRSREIVQGKWFMELGTGGIEVFQVNGVDVPVENVPQSLEFQPICELIEGELDYGSSWLCLGEPGVGKSTVGAQFALDGLARGESALMVTIDGPADQTRALLRNQGASIAEWEDSGRLALLDVFSDIGAEARNWDRLLHHVNRLLNRMQRPVRLVLDSLTPLQTVFGEEFFELILQKNRMLRRPGVAIFDTATDPGLSEETISLTIFYDVVLKLFTPDWSNLKLANSEGTRAMRIAKARGVKADLAPRLYTISEKSGICIQK